eukprot:Ihof_evm3s457 gene=Ihof_evmTU3s457
MSNSTEKCRLDLTQSIAHQGAITVGVVGVGGLSMEKFNYYFSLLSHFTTINLSDLNVEAPEYVGLDGQISLRFTPLALGTDKYQDLQYNRRILGLIGLIDCPSINDIAKASNEFQEIKEKVSTVLGCRCLAFEPTDSLPDTLKDVTVISNM